MTECALQLRVQAYHDGEMPAGERVEVEAHLATCPMCAGELRDLRAISVLLAPSEAMDPTSGEIAQMHAAVDDDARMAGGPSSLLRLGGLFAAMAASILVISGAWLADGSFPGRAVRNPTAPQWSAKDEDWQRVALTTVADPRPKVTSQSDSPYATHLADSQWSGWMVFSLDGIRAGAPEPKR